MVKASGQIEKELGLLQQRTEDMSTNLDTLYDGYLKALGAASGQQLMSAVYHLCTQAYPDKFLALSWKQRNELQTSLQTLAAQIQVQLDEQRSQAKKNSRKPSKSSGLAFLQRLLEARSSGAIIQTSEGSSEDLLDKLSEIAQFESSAKRLDDSDLSEQPENGEPDLADLASEDGADSSDASSDDAITSAESFERLDFESSLGSDSDATAAQKATPKAGDDVTQSVDPDDLSESASDPLSDSLSDQASDQALADEFDFEMDIPAAEQRLTVADEEDLLGALEALARRSADEDDDAPESPLAPIHLLKQQMLMEKAIRDVFRTVSEATNELLQKANVMPNFPKALMAAAADTRGLGEPANAVPNVVKVSVRVMHGEANFESANFDEEEFSGELGNEDKDWRQMRKMRPDSRRSSSHRRPNQRAGQGRGRRSDSGGENRRRDRSNGRSDEGRSRRLDAPSSRPFLSRDAIEIEAFPEFAVVNLQLSEVEFADPRVSVWRGRLRKELSHLKQLGLRYKKTQKTLETAQAEDAWRSSWTSLEES